MKIFSITHKQADPLEKVVLSSHPVILNITLETLRQDNTVDTTKLSPLHRAVRLGLEEAVESLIKFGSDPNEKNTLGEIPLHVAVRMNRVDIVRLLIPHSQINTANYFGLTPLHWACLFGYTTIVELLLLYGADPNIHAIEADGLTPKDFARLMNHKDIVEAIDSFSPVR